MTQAQLADGRILEFPDGTDPAVIQSTVKRILGVDETKELSPLETVQQAASEIGERELSAQQSILEPALALTTGAIAEPVAGIAGIAQTLNPFAEPGAGGRAVSATREALTVQPKTEAGQEGLERTAKLVAPITEKFQEAEEFLGERALEGTGSPLLAAASATIPTALAEILTLKGLTRVGKSVPKISVKSKLAAQIQQGGTDKGIAKFIVDGAGKLGKDKIAIEAIKQGFDEGVIAAVKGSTRTDRIKMGAMVRIMKKGRANALFATKNRPSDIAGNSLLDRVNHIKRVNVSAGKRLDSVAKALKGKQVDSTAPVDKFLNNLDDMGITLDGDLNPVFKGSIIEDLDGPQNAISRVVKRLAKADGPPDAFDLHRMKKFIDENVTFGKSGEGLGGKTEGVLKTLRRDIDGVLDSNFPKYDKVNTAFSETINALDSLQDVAGQKMDLFGPNANKAVGTLLRRLMGNAQSRVNLVDAVDEVEKIASKFGGKFKDDISVQMLFADELDDIFGPVARTSFKGEIGKEVQRGLNQTAVGFAAEGAGKIAEKIRGISDENAIKAVEQLLRR